MQQEKNENYKPFENFKNDSSSYLEKGSVELLSTNKYELEKNKYMEEKELLFTKEDKDDDKISRNSRSQSDFGINSCGKRFDVDALNKDLADIEKRLKASKMNWQNNTRTTNNYNDSERKWQSMAEVDVHHDSQNNPVTESGIVLNESPILSDCGGGAMKWDYGADIGLSTHGDSGDEFDPMTWPVTAEQAAKEQAEQAANGGRRMKSSASQGSFLASPDPDHRQNIIAKASAELAATEADITTHSSYKSSFDEYQPKILNDHSKWLSYPPNFVGEKHEKECLSANTIMDQAEEAEKRLRQRLENVKSMHFNGSISKDERPHSITRPTELERKTEPKSNTDEMFTSSGKHNVQIRRFFLDGKSTGSNTGRTSTVESTHTFSDYGKAPLFSTSVYGTREDNALRNNYPNNLMYSKRNKESVLGRTTELETISSRETLNIIPDNETDKSNNNVGDRLPPSHYFDPSTQIQHKPDSGEYIPRTNKNFDNKKEYGKPVGVPVVPPISIPHLPAPAPINSGLSSNGYRQQNSSTTFTSITTANGSPRQCIDSFDTDYGMGSPRGLGIPGIPSLYHQEDGTNDKRQENRIKDIPLATAALTENSKQNEQGHQYRYSSNPPEHRNLYSRSPNRYGRRLGANDGNEDDGEDDDENNRRRRQYEMDKRKERHAATAQAFKNLRMNQQAQSRDRRHNIDNAGGETTASELEHDDNEDEQEKNETERNSMRNRRQDENGTRKKKKKIAKLVHELNSTKHHSDRRRSSNGGNKKDDSPPESTSVDTVMLMDRLATMLGNNHQQGRPHMDNKQLAQTYPHQSQNKPIESLRRQTTLDHMNGYQRDQIDMRNYPPQPPLPPSQKHIYHSNVPPYRDIHREQQQQQPPLMPGIDSKLAVRHLLLKHKVKLLVDCVREENRRRKIKKLEKMLEFHDYNEQTQLALPDDLYTETATVIGSDNVGSIGDLETLSESWSCRSSQIERHDNIPSPPLPYFHQEHEDEMQYVHNDNYYYPYDDPADQNQPEYHQEFYDEIPNENGERNSFRQQYSQYKKDRDHHKGGSDQKHSKKKSKRKVYPPSQAWNIPLQEASHDANLNNDSNAYYEQEFEVEQDKYKSSHYRGHYDDARQPPSSGRQKSNRKSNRTKPRLEYIDHCFEDDKMAHCRDRYDEPYDYNYDQYHNSRYAESRGHNNRYASQKRYGDLSTGRSTNQSGMIESGRMLTLRERINLIREADAARQHNAHRVEKDLRRTSTKSTKVSNGGLAWVVGSEDGNHYTDSNRFRNSGDEQKAKSDLQVAFENRMNDFISRSKQRQKRIKLASDERRYQSQMSLERAKLFAESPQPIDNEHYHPNNGYLYNEKPGTFKRRRPITQPDPLSAEKMEITSGRTDNKSDNGTTLDRPVVTKLDLSKLRSRSKKDKYLETTAEHLFKPQPRRFSKNEMIHNSARKYKNLPEMQQKYFDERKKARIQHNRIKMMQYSEKILSQVLRSRGPWITEKST